MAGHRVRIQAVYLQDVCDLAALFQKLGVNFREFPSASLTSISSIQDMIFFRLISVPANPAG